MSDDSLALIQAREAIEPHERVLIDAMCVDEEMRVSEGERVAGLDQGVGYRLLKKDSVRKYLSLTLADRRERHREIRDKVIQTLWALACYDIADAIEPEEDFDRYPESLDGALGMLAGGRLKPPHKLPPTLRAAIKSVKHGKHGWEYTFVDRTQILLALMDHFGDSDAARANEPNEGRTVVEETRRIIYYDAIDK